MGFTFIASSAAYNTLGAGTLDTDETFNIAAGDLIVALASTITDTTIVIADEDGNNDLTMFARETITSTYAAFGYKISATEAIGKVVRVTFGVSAANRNIVVMQFRPDGGDVVSLEEGDNPATGTSANPISNSINTTGTDELVVGVTMDRFGKTFSSPEIDGNAADGSEWEEVGNTYIALWYKIFGSTQTGINADITISSSTVWSCDIVAFKSVAAGGGIVVLRRRRM